MLFPWGHIRQLGNQIEFISGIVVAVTRSGSVFSKGLQFLSDLLDVVRDYFFSVMG